MAKQTVSIVFDYYADPTVGRPIFNGSVYIGEPDQDPELFPKQVYHRQEDGTDVPISQPLLTGAGGVIMISGSPAHIVTDDLYSMRVRDRNGVEVYYSSTVDYSAEVTDPVFVDTVTFRPSNGRADTTLTPGVISFIGGTSTIIEMEDDASNQGWGFNYFDADSNAYTFGFSAFNGNNTAFWTFPAHTKLIIDGPIKYGPDQLPYLAGDSPIRPGFFVIGDSLTDSNSADGNDPYGDPIPDSWSRRMVEEGTADITQDADNGRTVVAYSYPSGTYGPVAGRELIILQLGTNDVGSDPGTTSATPANLAAYETAYENLLQDLLDDSWEADNIAVVLPFQIGITPSVGTGKVEEYKQATRNACATKGVTQIWDFAIGDFNYGEWALGSGVHPSQDGFDLMAQEMYLRMSQWVNQQYGDASSLWDQNGNLIATATGFGLTVTGIMNSDFSVVNDHYNGKNVPKISAFINSGATPTVNNQNGPFSITGVVQDAVGDYTVSIDTPVTNMRGHANVRGLAVAAVIPQSTTTARVVIMVTVDGSQADVDFDLFLYGE